MWNAEEYNTGSLLQNTLNDRYLPYCEAIFRDKHIDIGCGNGRTTQFMAKNNPSTNFIGIDADTNMIAFAKQNYPLDNIEYIAKLAENISEAADSVTSFMCWHWISDIESLARKVFKLLSLDGYLFIMVPNVTASVSNIFDLLAHAQRCIVPDAKLSPLPYRREHRVYCNTLLKAGFTIETEVHHTTPFALPSIGHYIDFIKSLSLIDDACNTVEKAKIYDIFQRDCLQYMEKYHEGAICHPDTFSIILAKKR